VDWTNPINERATISTQKNKNTNSRKSSRRQVRFGGSKYNLPLKRPTGKSLLDCTLDELIRLNMTKREIRESKISDWVAEHGDCEYPY
jgi:hypothetical protein